MLDSQNSQLRVRHKTANSFAVAEHRLKDHPVLLAGMNHSQARLIKPALNTFNGFLESERAPM
jgi:hypothetical protein